MEGTYSCNDGTNLRSLGRNNGRAVIFGHVVDNEGNYGGCGQQRGYNGRNGDHARRATGFVTHSCYTICNGYAKEYLDSYGWVGRFFFVCPLVFVGVFLFGGNCCGVSTTRYCHACRGYKGGRL